MKRRNKTEKQRAADAASEAVRPEGQASAEAAEIAEKAREAAGADAPDGAGTPDGPDASGSGLSAGNSAEAGEGEQDDAARTAGAASTTSGAGGDVNPGKGINSNDDTPIGSVHAESDLSGLDTPAEHDPSRADVTEPFSAVPPIGPDAFDVYRDSTGGAFGAPGLREADSLEQFLGADGDYAGLPSPEVFNAYPPEVQRKIMEWTDRDVRARRDDESRRQDELVRSQVERERRRQSIPFIITILAILAGAITGVVTGNPVFTLVFLIVPIVVIVERIVTDGGDDKGGRYRKLPRG